MTFFDYSMPVRPVDEFGIRDDTEGKKNLRKSHLSEEPADQKQMLPAEELPAFIDYTCKEKWNAVVESYGREDFNFIPVDNNIPYLDENGNEKSRCDAIIFTERTIVFIELKDKDRNWLTDAIAQLKSTIGHFMEEEDISRFKYKKAYACNRSHPYFNYQFKDCMQRFYRETGIPLRPMMVIRNIK